MPTEARSAKAKRWVRKRGPGCSNRSPKASFTTNPSRSEEEESSSSLTGPLGRCQLFRLRNLRDQRRNRRGVTGNGPDRRDGEAQILRAGRPDGHEPGRGPVHGPIPIPLYTRFDSKNHYANAGKFPLALEGGGQQIAVEPATEDIYLGRLRAAASTRPRNRSARSARPTLMPPKRHPRLQSSKPKAGSAGSAGSPSTPRAKRCTSPRANESAYFATGRRSRRGKWAPRGRRKSGPSRPCFRSSFIDGNAQASYKFEYGPTDSYGQETRDRPQLRVNSSRRRSARASPVFSPTPRTTSA